MNVIRVEEDQLYGGGGYSPRSPQQFVIEGPAAPKIDQTDLHLLCEALRADMLDTRERRLSVSYEEWSRFRFVPRLLVSAELFRVPRGDRNTAEHRVEPRIRGAWLRLTDPRVLAEDEVPKRQVRVRVMIDPKTNSQCGAHITAGFTPEDLLWAVIADPNFIEEYYVAKLTDDDLKLLSDPVYRDRCAGLIQTAKKPVVRTTRASAGDKPWAQAFDGMIEVPDAEEPAA